jgi:peptidoglycan/xylan/chitin deacetylase (PgdA/CDA1 family)
MTRNPNLGGKREWLAQGLLWSGAALLLSRLPARDSLLVLNYHRIGNPEEDLFDPGVFSATPDQFDDQISYLKQRISLVNLEEALAFIGGSLKEKTRQCRVLLTFDDGYLDNYEVAYPILRSHGVQGVFFLTTSMVGSSQVAWWGHIAYLVKTARKRHFTLRYPYHLDVDIDRKGLSNSIRNILKLYKMPENTDSARFIRELEEVAEGDDLPQPFRRFLNWDEAREMSRGGMAFGSHTHLHPVLSQLEPEQQFKELTESKAILEKQLGASGDVLAYPVGDMSSFTSQSMILAEKAGYRAAFSFYGGANLPGQTSPYDMKRIAINYQSRSRFRVQTAMSRISGQFWP